MTWFLKVIHNLGSFVQELFSFYQTTADERRTAEKETSICWRTKGWAKQAYLSQQAKVTAAAEEDAAETPPSAQWYVVVQEKETSSYTKLHRTESMAIYLYLWLLLLRAGCKH